MQSSEINGIEEVHEFRIKFDDEHIYMELTFPSHMSAEERERVTARMLECLNDCLGS